MNIIVAARKKWLDAINTRNMYNIMDCYHKNHIFKGTLSRKVTYTENELKKYFERLLEMKPKVVFVKSDLKNIDGIYFDSGTYVFTFPSNKQINANYQFVYKVVGTEVKLISHFSSSIGK